MIVLDASAAVELLLRPGRHPRMLEAVLDSSRTLAAPHLLDLEVAQVLRRYAHSGEIGAVRAEQALADYADFRITRHAHAPLVPRIWQLRRNATAYDAVYLALAEALDCPLLTCDAALTAVPGHRARVTVFRG